MATKRTTYHAQAPKSMRKVADGSENQPPSRIAKRTASIAGLFEQGKRLRRKNGEHTSNESRSTEIKIATDDLFAGFTESRKPTKNPLYHNFKEAVNTYREGMGSSVSEQLRPISEALVARVNGLDIDGNPLNTPGVPTLAQVEALDEAHLALSKPLSQDAVPVQMQRDDGTHTATYIKIEQIVQAFERRRAKKLTEIRKLGEELDKVLMDIQHAHEALCNDDEAILRAKKKHDSEKAAIRQRAALLKQQSLDEIEKAQKEDRAATVETNRRFQEFMMALQ